MSKILNVLNKQRSTVIKKCHRNIQTVRLSKDLQQAKEVIIPVPWGHIAGKWWGPEDVRPILGLHGWQDNCGTFDTLAPLLPPHMSLLAIDFPGHGTSSRIPDGLMYTTSELIAILFRIQKYFGWEKMSLLGHSMGSIATFMYSAIYPELVDMAIGMDALKPHIFPTEKISMMFRKKIADFWVIDNRNIENSEPPCYTLQEMIERWHLGTDKSIAKDKCHHLLERTISESKQYPNKYYFTRDSRLKCIIFSSIAQETSLALARNINMPYMATKCTNSSYYEEKKNYLDVIEILKENPYFEHHMIEGTHHAHLNEPEKFKAIINNFINRYRPPI